MAGLQVELPSYQLPVTPLPLAPGQHIHLFPRMDLFWLVLQWLWANSDTQDTIVTEHQGADNIQSHGAS